jgi:ElaB/YqjD/DUF883 family membrane-anchored ribosome-binding protein
MADRKGESESPDETADLAGLRAEIARLSSALGELAQNQAAAASERVRAAVDGARASVGSSAADAQESLHKASAELAATVERNPLVAVLIAAIIGFIFGISTRDRR